MDKRITYLIMGLIILVFALYYYQYFGYAEFFLTNYAPRYFPGVLP